MASDPIPGMESVIASVTGYGGEERENLIKLMTHAGASYIGTLSPSNAFTHLVCRKFEGKKYEQARKMKLIIVNHRWIEDSVKEGRRVPEHRYTLQSGKEVGPLRMEVPTVVKPVLLDKKGKAVSDKSHVFGGSREVIDLGCRSSRRGRLSDLRLWNEKSSPEVKENNSSLKSKNKSLKTYSKKELKSSSRDCFEDHPLSKSLRTKELCRPSAKAKRNNLHDIGTSMAEIPYKRKRLMKTNSDSRISVLSDSESDQECQPIRFHSIRNDRVTILSDDSNDDIDTGKRIRDERSKAQEGAPEKGCREVDTSNKEVETSSESELATKSSSPELSCAICWTEFSTTRGILPCGHRYCYPCIENWAAQLGSRRKISTCPLCKASFTFITKVDDALTSDQNIFSQTIPSAQKVDISIFNDHGTSNFAAQSVSGNGCSVCHSSEPEELLICCTVCQNQSIHTYCQDPPSASTTWTCIYCKDLRRLYLHHHHHHRY